MLAESSGPYFLGETASLADCAAYEVLDFYRHVYGDAIFRQTFSKWPHLLALHDAVLGLGRMKEWRDEGRAAEFIPEWSEYAKSVRATLYP